ncbi:hypothetical protein DORLON_01981 [Dorea longicatena DSM 13814]|uniref:Uncharacterized protein n=1 Tax=Dorea longicatena DSM 13814 TaxID=411462 RepID=A6BI53_9FIRM|nr:hypothetical protein DORLON_01981 [Dorea longicatena DSM 13814]
MRMMYHISQTAYAAVYKTYNCSGQYCRKKYK